jgi:GNAT superfamily N-acetyltransferase
MAIPPGFIVQALAEDTWRLAEVISHKGASYYLHFIGEDNIADNWVTSDCVRRLTPQELASLAKSEDLSGPEFLSLLTVRKPHRHIKTVSYVELGLKTRLQAWYPSPYPLAYQSPSSDELLICDTCLAFFKDREDRAMHWKTACGWSHPPGDEIYRSGSESAQEPVSLFEIKGWEFPAYCERLVLFSKLFLEEKRTADRQTSQYTQVRAFTFYVMVRWDATLGVAEMVGYFSRLQSTAQVSNILSCILVLPHMQRRGYGKFLINAAYELSARERRRGSAERPLSALGKVSFYSFWASRVLDELLVEDSSVRLLDLSLRTGITAEDIGECLRELGILKECGNSVVLLATPEALELLKKKAGSKGFPFDADRVIWTPDTVFEGEPNLYIQDQVSTPRKSVTTTTGSSDSPVQ